ncbi:MAG: SDR family oxidoreductase [Candidatus Kapabacteria bacterium]|nr:SDR family oxidoreductase [Candidatus Kapabacteria bacterium]
MSVALITGAASGIGKAIAHLFVEKGASVVLADIDDAQGRALEAELQSRSGRALFVHCDVANPQHHQQAVDEALRTFGRLDVAVNNAGIAGQGGPTAQYPIDEWQRIIDVNLSGVFYGLRAQLPVMIQQGSGSIIVVSSILGAVGFAGAPAYTAAKHGLLGLVKAAALDHSSQGVRINAIGPAFIDTPMIAGIVQDPVVAQVVTGKHPIGRLGRPEEVAQLVHFLSSDLSSFITGSFFPIDGGYLAQ